jgi:hypothetical protein
MTISFVETPAGLSEIIIIRYAIIIDGFKVEANLF